MNSMWATDRKHFKSVAGKRKMKLAHSQTFGTYGHFFKMPTEQYASGTYKTILYPLTQEFPKFLPKNIHSKCYYYKKKFVNMKY